MKCNCHMKDEPTHIGAAVLIADVKPLRTEYAKRIFRKHPERKAELSRLEQLLTRPPTSAIEGMCRDQVLLRSEDILKIAKEIDVATYDDLKKRKSYLLNVKEKRS